MTKNDLGLREKFLALETELNGEIFDIVTGKQIGRAHV